MMLVQRGDYPPQHSCAERRGCEETEMTKQLDESEVLQRRTVVHLTINGERTSVDVPVTEQLIDTLRTTLGLTGTKVSCEVGACGVCTIVRDGFPAPSCLLLTVLVDGSEIWTIEGLAEQPGLDRLRSCMIEEGGVQCGFCTAGQLANAAVILGLVPDATPRATTRPPSSDAQQAPKPSIAEQLMGNLCRCTGYYGVVRAIEEAGR